MVGTWANGTVSTFSTYALFSSLFHLIPFCLSYCFLFILQTVSDGPQTGTVSLKTLSCFKTD